MAVSETSPDDPNLILSPDESPEKETLSWLRKLSNAWQPIHLGTHADELAIGALVEAKGVQVRGQSMERCEARLTVDGVRWQRMLRECVGKDTRKVCMLVLRFIYNGVANVESTEQPRPREPNETEDTVVPAAPAVANEPAPKRSTKRGAGQTKLIAALTMHHKYAYGGCMNLEPIGNNELARLAKVGAATATRFFDKWFDGHAAYHGICRRNTSKLVDTIKAMNGEFIPSNEPNYGAAPAGEYESD